VVICNLVFGAMHYFTLRWRLQWCVMAFLGGMGFSYSFAQHNDLFVIIGIHWVATFFNTPAAPAGRSDE
jgi:membrane protease YdiL (CAAX protease family)